MAEPVLDNPGPLDDLARAIGPEPVPSAGPVRVGAGKGKPTDEMIQQWRARWDEMRERVRRPVNDARRGLARELNQNADYVRNRARHYHQHRPLQVLGVIAAAGFALGLLLGLWRRS